MMYVIIDKMEHEFYPCDNEIELGFRLDQITAERDRLEIPYKTINYNFGKIVIIDNI